MSAINYIELAKAAKAAAAECIALARRTDHSCHYTQRGVEILAIDDQGERIGDPLDIIEVKDLSGKCLQLIVEHGAPAQYATICVQGGIDQHDSLHDALHCPDDYEPGVQWWAVSSDQLAERSERIPLEESNAHARDGHLGVAARLDANSIRMNR